MPETTTEFGSEIDESKVKRILNKIIMTEKMNQRTKQYSTEQMIKKIKDMIEEEVKCY